MTKNEMDRLERKKIIGLITFLVAFPCLLYGYRYYALKNTEETFGVFIEKNEGTGINQKYFLFKTKNGKTYKSSTIFKERIKIGDTLWIKYSISDPKIIDVIDKDYKKYLKK